MNATASRSKDLRRIFARWGLALVAAVVPPGLSLVSLAALWVVSLAWHGRMGVGLAATLSVIALVGNVVLYAGL